MATSCLSKRQVIDENDPTQALPNSTASSVGSVVGFTCKTDNYVIAGSYNYVTCLSSGQWDKPDPVCEETFWTTTNILIVSICSAVAGLLIIFLISALSWYFCCRDDQRRRRRHETKVSHVYHQGDTKRLYYQSSRSSSPSYGGHYNDELRNNKTPPLGSKGAGPLVVPPGPPSAHATVNSKGPVPAAIIYDPVRNIWIDEYDVSLPRTPWYCNEAYFHGRIKIPRPATASSKPLEPWSVERDYYYM